MNRRTPLLAAGLVLLGVGLNWPMFLPGELPFRGSIEGGYAGMARFVSENPNPWGWNPQVYCGVPTQFLYLPALPYLTAAVARAAPEVPPEYLYRLITAVAACLAPVTVFLFALYFTRSSGWSLVAAAAFLLASPAYGLFPAVDKDRGAIYLPWRIQVLAKYGEGPHNFGLMLLPLTLMAVWRAATRRGFRPMALAAAMLAAVALTNWVASLALAIACVLLMLAASGEKEFRVWRVAAAGVLGYLLACFWLTPSFIRIVVLNWPSDAFGFRFGFAQKCLLAGLAVTVLAVRAIFRRFPGSSYFCFVTLCALVFGWLGIAFYVFHVDTIPESRRYALEFEMFLMLALAEGFRRALRVQNPTARLTVFGVGAALLIAAAPQVAAYTMQPWQAWRPVAKEETVEHRLAKWLADRRPQGRVMVSGGLRFRLNQWYALPQVGGGFESGLRNRLPVDLAYQVRTAKALTPERAESDTILLLKVLGVQYVVVHGPASREYYRDWLTPWRLRSLPVAWREGDDTVYELPPPNPARLLAVDELPGWLAQDRPWVTERYVAAGEDRSRPRLKVERPEPGRFTIEGAIPPQRLIGLQEVWEWGWEARQDGREIVVGPDYLGFIALQPWPAERTRIELRYKGSREQRLMAGVSLLAWLGMAAMALRRR